MPKRRKTTFPCDEGCSRTLTVRTRAPATGGSWGDLVKIKRQIDKAGWTMYRSREGPPHVITAACNQCKPKVH